MRNCSIIAIMIFLSTAAQADQDKIELETTRIKANQELPQILYLVPWKDVETSKSANQKLRLHDFFGDLYDPIAPSQPFGHAEQLYRVAD